MKTITVTSNDSTNKRRLRFPFSTAELGIFVVVLAALLIAAFFIMAPKRAIDDAADVRRRGDIRRVYDAITLYLIDQGGETPSYSGGTDIPAVTTTDILNVGISVDLLDNFVPDYITAFPKDPDGTSYKIGLLANGRVAVAASLSTGETYIVSESSPAVIQDVINGEDEDDSNTNPPGGIPTGDYSD